MICDFSYLRDGYGLPMVPQNGTTVYWEEWLSRQFDVEPNLVFKGRLKDRWKGPKIWSMPDTEFENTVSLTRIQTPMRHSYPRNFHALELYFILPEYLERTLHLFLCRTFGIKYTPLVLGDMTIVIPISKGRTDMGYSVGRPPWFDRNDAVELRKFIS